MSAAVLRVLALSLALALLLLPNYAAAQCSAEDISAYVQSGATPEQLSQLCGGQRPSFSYGQAGTPGPGSYDPGYDQTRAASACVTRIGACPMAVQLPVGSDCACYTQVGPVAGIAR